MLEVCGYVWHLPTFFTRISTIERHRRVLLIRSPEPSRTGQKSSEHCSTQKLVCSCEHVLPVQSGRTTTAAVWSLSSHSYGVVDEREGCSAVLLARSRHQTFLPSLSRRPPLRLCVYLPLTLSLSPSLWAPHSQSAGWTTLSCDGRSMGDDFTSYEIMSWFVLLNLGVLLKLEAHVIVIVRIYNAGLLLMLSVLHCRITG